MRSGPREIQCKKKLERGIKFTQNTELTCYPNRFLTSLLVLIQTFGRGLMWRSTIHGGSPAAIASLSVDRKICTNPDSYGQKQKAFNRISVLDHLHFQVN